MPEPNWAAIAAVLDSWKARRIERRKRQDLARMAYSLQRERMSGKSEMLATIRERLAERGVVR